MVSGEQFRRIKFGDRYFYTHRVGTFKKMLRRSIEYSKFKLVSFECLFQGSQSHGLGRITKSFVLQRWVLPTWQNTNLIFSSRTLGDIICDNSLMDSTQKWVTLQPDSDYNPK